MRRLRPFRLGLRHLHGLVRSKPQAEVLIGARIAELTRWAA